MALGIFGKRTTVLSSSKAADLPSASQASQALRRLGRVSRLQRLARDWRHAGEIALAAAFAEAAVAAINDVSAIPWPGLLQIGVGYAAFIIILTWPGLGFVSGSEQ